MPGSGSDVGTVAGLVAAGVGLGGIMVFLGFLAGQSSSAPPAPARKQAGTGGRRRRRQLADSDEEDSDGRSPETTTKSRGTGSKALMTTENVFGAGFSMEEARQMADEGHATAMTRTPQQVLAELQRGNVRFWTGQATRPEKSAFERRALISKQFPSVAILGCSDSRVPIEIVFDQGLGDIFVIRVAGNCLDTATTASLQYAVHHLKVKLLIVMGHEGCGAVKAAQLPMDAINKEPESLGNLLKGMRRGLDAADLANVQDQKAADREAVATNVKAQVERLVRDQGIMKKVSGGELIMLGAVYEISSGIVDFFHEVSGDDGSAADPAPNKAPSQGVLTRFVSNNTLDK